MSRRWSVEEDGLLASFYPTHGAMWEEWKNYLPDRSYAAIVARAHRLGVVLTDDAKVVGRAKAYAVLGRAWTEAEDKVLARHFPDHGAGWRGWALILPKRTCEAIYNRARKLGIERRRQFTDAERSRILRLTVNLANSMGVGPYDVAMEIVRLGDEYERGMR